MSRSNFSTLPTISITRSKFNRRSQCKTTINLGKLCPIYLDEVLPGDTRSIDIASLVRMSTPVTPIMDNIYADVYAFFVPNRIVWNHWKEFMGENNTSAGIYSGLAYAIPTIALDGTGSGIGTGSIGDYYGLPTKLTGGDTEVSLLPVRGYRRIYNRFFRDQNVIAPVTVSLGDIPATGDDYSALPFNVAKVSDYFTRSLPYAQKGAPVSIPLGTTAPVMINKTGVNFTSGTNYLMGFTGNGSTSMTLNSSRSIYLDTSGNVQGSTNVYADLSNATSATINQLRFAFQYQKLLERDSLFGTRYWEILKGHFSVIAPDASLQDPELLGHRKIHVNIDQVVQTTGVNQATPASNQLGATAAVSVTGDAGNLFTKSFTEHGYIHILVCFRHDQTYCQGIERHWTRNHRTDFYFPEFANLGAQNVLRKEIYATGSDVNDEVVFGFQEAWAEYRYKPSKLTGLMALTATGNLGYWNLGNYFSSAPTLGQTFIEQDRNAIARCLQTGSVGPDFICDFAFRDVAVRPMPLYSIPGLIDHH